MEMSYFWSFLASVSEMQLFGLDQHDDQTTEKQLWSARETWLPEVEGH